MSRKCPKRYHLFLRCLKSNWYRFPCQPRLIGWREGRVEFVLAGINSAVRFYYYVNTSSIEVFICWEGETWERVWCIFEPQGYIDKKLRDERLNKECFEPLLDWCNGWLTSTRYLEFLQIGQFQTACLAGKPDENGQCVTLSEMWSELTEHCSGEYRTFFVPLRK